VKKGNVDQQLPGNTVQHLEGSHLQVTGCSQMRLQLAASAFTAQNISQRKFQ
jgi:hypothetical protein